MDREDYQHPTTNQPLHGEKRPLVPAILAVTGLVVLVVLVVLLLTWLTYNAG